MYHELDAHEKYLSETQGQVFEKSCGMGLDSRKFISAYMNGVSASNFDLPHHKIRWSGKMHLLSCALDEQEIPKGEVWNVDAMFWIGYAYRYWAFMTGQKSKEIFKIADGDMMMGLWRRLHMDNIESAVNAILTESLVPRKDRPQKMTKTALYCGDDASPSP